MTTWNALKNAPSFAASAMLLLTDGTVMCQADADSAWWKLTPDITGSYLAGTWSQLRSMNWKRKFFASYAMYDGRVMVVGGEYSTNPSGTSVPDTSSGEIYDPEADVWTVITTPFTWIQGDVPSCMLPDGRILFGAINSNRTAVYDPRRNTWTEAGTKFGTVAATKADGTTDEEGWILMHDGTVLTVEVNNSGKAEKYLPATDEWVTAGTPSVTLPEDGEIGPGMCLPDGRVLWIGATGHTAYYTPGAQPSAAGTWAAGPDIKDSAGTLYTVNDGPATLLPNGTVMLIAGVRHQEGNAFWSGPSKLFILDPKANKVTLQSEQPSNLGGDTWSTRLMLLPNGQPMLTTAGTSVLLQNAVQGWDASWVPKVTGWAHTWLVAGETYVVNGTQLNGLSQGSTYGDDFTPQTNYPMARLVFNATGHCYYCKATDFSSYAIGANAGASFRFMVPPDLNEMGAALLIVSANGIPADPIPVMAVPYADSGAGQLLSHQGRTQLDAAFFDQQGRLRIVWAFGEFQWTGPTFVTGANAGKPGTPVALAYQNAPGTPRQLDAIFIDAAGALAVCWVIEEGAWSGPQRISATGVAPAGGHVAVAHQTTTGQLDALFFDNQGRLNVAWVTGEGAWHAPVAITAASTAPAGAPLALAHQTDNNQLDAVFIDASGALAVCWVTGEGNWAGPSRIGASGVASPGAAVALAHQAVANQLDAMFIGKDGRLNVAWVVNEGAWSGPTPIGSAGLAPSGAPLALSHQSDGNQLDAAFIGDDGALYVAWVVNDGAWNGPSPMTAKGVGAPGAKIALAHQGNLSQLDAVFVGPDDSLRVAWVQWNGAWQGPVTISPANTATPQPASPAPQPAKELETA